MKLLQFKLDALDSYVYFIALRHMYEVIEFPLSA